MLPLHVPRPVVALNRVLQRATTGLAVLGFSVLAAGCASETAQNVQPSLTFGEAGFTDALVTMGTDAIDPAPSHTESAVPAHTTADDWMDRTYVYRGGRDPKTGLARTQL